jgi:hypothetical protein
MTPNERRANEMFAVFGDDLGVETVVEKINIGNAKVGALRHAKA